MQKTWYSAEGSKLAELWTILHLPYTLMSLSFLAMGFGIDGVRRWDIFSATLLAYFLGLGISAHAFDQLPGMGSRYVKYLDNDDLIALALWGLVIAVAIGIYLMETLRAWHLLWMIPLQSFFVISYPIKRFANGFFHNDFWFTISFGAIPVMVGDYLNTLTITAEFIPWALVAALISGIEILLSRYVRQVRKDYSGLLSLRVDKPELAIKLLCVLSYLLAIIFVVR